MIEGLTLSNLLRWFITIYNTYVILIRIYIPIYNRRVKWSVRREVIHDDSVRFRRLSVCSPTLPLGAEWKPNRVN